MTSCWIPGDCPISQEYIGRWAKLLNKDKEIFELLYRLKQSQNIREFLLGLFSDKRVKIHAHAAGHDIFDFKSMLRFMSEEHQKAYAKLAQAENEYQHAIAQYNRNVEAYNQREAEREHIANLNSRVYTRVVPKTIEVRETVKIPTLAEDRNKELEKEILRSDNRNILLRIGEALMGTGGAFLNIITGTTIVGAAEVKNRPSHAPDCPLHPHNLSKGLFRKENCWCFKCISCMMLQGEMSQEAWTMYSKDGTFVNCCHKHAKPQYCNCGGNYVREAPSENSSEAILMRLVRTAELETVRTTPKKLPERLPFPNKPGEPDWGKIGWEHFENLDVNKVIWNVGHH